VILDCDGLLAYLDDAPSQHDVYQALTGVLRQRLEMKLAATADGIARLEAVSLQTFPLVDAASPLTSQFKRKGEVHHCPLGWMSLTCRPDLSNVAFLIGSALALGIQSTVEQFLRRGGYGNLEVQLASLDHALCHASEVEGAFMRTHNKWWRLSARILVVLDSSWIVTWGRCRRF